MLTCLSLSGSVIAFFFISRIDTAVDTILNAHQNDSSHLLGKIAVANAQKGDLVFFKTSNKNRISHVGLVIANRNGEVRFVHASSSRGVMVSSLNDGYWKKTFSEARRVL